MAGLGNSGSATAEASGETFSHVMDHVAQGFEALGAAVLVAGIVWSFVLAVVAWRRSGRPATGYVVLRSAFGGTLRAGPGPIGGWEVEAMLHDCSAPAPA